MKTHPPTQTFGCFDVAWRVQWLEAKGDPLSRLDLVIDWEGFRPLLVQALAKPSTPFVGIKPYGKCQFKSFPQ